MSATQIDIERRDRVTHGDYVAKLPNSGATAKLSWTMRDGVRHAEHTFVPPEARGQGLAGQLVEALVEDARREGVTIAPDCSYVAAAFRRHPEWDDLRAR